MTFTEAAVEVLRLVGKPLHYKKITEVAIERNLLSHVGKTPEVTMSSRLATMVKRDRGEAPIIKVKPGVFGLREFSEEQLADLSGDVDELPEAEVTENENPKPEDVVLSEAPPAAPGALVEVVEAKPTVLLPRKPLPGADVFPEEDDDDEPILGGDDDDDEDEEGEAAEGGEAGQNGESRSQRRRRKRRRRGPDEPAEEPRDARPREEREAPREASREPLPREAPARDAGREPRNGRRDERSGRRDERSGRRDERSGREREPREHREREERRPERRDELMLDMSREPADGDLLGKDLADAVASVLSQSGPRGLPAIRVADLLVRKGRLQGDPGALLPTVMAAVRADSARRRHEPRARFRVEGSSIILTDFLLPPEVVRAEQDVLRAAAQQRERVRRAFLRKLGELPAAGLAELLATWLNAEGVVGLRAVRRPGAGSGELHLAGTLRRGPEDVRIAVIICRDGRELGREKIIEARGALHHYGNATTAWLITLGSVLSGAREEAAAPANVPVALFDGLSLATAMERAGVGIGVQQISISSLDFDLLDALRGTSPRVAEGDERGRGRDRNRDRDRDRDRGDRGDRERPRLVLERPVVQREEREEPEETEEGEDPEDALDGASPEAPEEEGGSAPEAAGEAGAEAQGESREGARRRRRRRRRKGGRGAEGQLVGAAGEGEVAELAEDADEEEEETPAEEGEAASPEELARDPYDDEEEAAGSEDERVASTRERGHDGDADEPEVEGDEDSDDDPESQRERELADDGDDEHPVGQDEDARRQDDREDD